MLAVMKKELTWREHIERCLQLRESKKAYCEKNNLSYHLFFYYQRKLLESTSQHGFQEIILEKTNVKDVQPDESGTSVLQVQFTNGNTLLFSEHLLERVFELCQKSSS